MLYLQSFAVLVALTFSDRAVLSNPSCAYEQGPHFCELITKVNQQNQENEHHLTTNHFDEAMSRLTTANQAIRNLLKTKEKDALLEPLRRALDSESGALFRVLSKCKNNVTISPCGTIFRGLFKATTDLVEATMEVTAEAKKEAIQKLYNAFNDGGKKSESVYGLATDVLKVLEQH